LCRPQKRKSVSQDSYEVFSKRGQDVPEAEVEWEESRSVGFKAPPAPRAFSSPSVSPVLSANTPNSDSSGDSSPGTSPGNSPQFRPLNGSRVVGLIALGLFRFPSNSPQTRLFQNLNEIYNLSPGSEAVPSSSSGSASMPPLDLAKDSAEPVLASEPEGELSKADAAELAPVLSSFQSKVQDGRLVLCREDLRNGLHWKALGLFLTSRPEIYSLRLQGMDISTSDARELGSTCLRSIRHITFCENNLGVNEGSLGMLVGLLCAAEVLESASIVRNNIKDYHVPNILDLIRQHSSTLARLSLCWNGLRDQGAVKLAKHIRFLFAKSHPSLKCALTNVDLSYNRIGEMGQAHLTTMQVELQRQGRHISVDTKHNQTDFCKKAAYGASSWFNFGRSPFAFAVATPFV